MVSFSDAYLNIQTRLATDLPHALAQFDGTIILCLWREDGTIVVIE